jgi:rod shape-determining protein MreD
MNPVFGFLFLIIIVLLEVSVLPFLTVGGVQFSPLLLVLLSLQFLGLSNHSYYGAFLGGILLDLFTGRSLGSSSCGLLFISGAVGLFRRRAEGSLPALLLVTFLASLFFRLIEAFPVFVSLMVVRGGLLDVGLMLLIYPCSRYFLRNVFGRREIQIGV